MQEERGSVGILKGSLAVVVLLLPLVFSLCGCATTAGIEGSAAALEGEEGDIQYSKYVIVNNPKLARGIQIVDLQSQFSGDLMKANVTLVNKYSQTLDFKYKFSWFAADGMEIDPESATWSPLILYGNESKTIQGVAPNPSAKKFRINIR